MAIPVLPLPYSRPVSPKCCIKRVAKATWDVRSPMVAAMKNMSCFGNMLVWCVTE